VREHGLCCVECHASGTAQGEHAGMTVERERIIKELEANEHIWRERVVLVALKALIKGENK